MPGLQAFPSIHHKHRTTAHIQGTANVSWFSFSVHPTLSSTLHSRPNYLIACILVCSLLTLLLILSHSLTHSIYVSYEYLWCTVQYCTVTYQNNIDKPLDESYWCTEKMSRTLVEARFSSVLKTSVQTRQVPRKKGAMQIHSERCRTIVELSVSDMKQADIARRLKLHRATVSAIIKRYNRKKTIKWVETRGRKYCLIKRSLRLLKSYVCKSCFQTLHLITAKFVENIGINDSVSILRRCLHQLKLNSYMAVPKPFLKPRHIKARIKCARSYSKWHDCKWSQVAFSDESSFAVCSSNKRMRLLRKKNERFLRLHSSPTFKYGYEVVSVWGAFSVHGRTTLVNYLRTGTKSSINIF